MIDQRSTLCWGIATKCTLQSPVPRIKGVLQCSTTMKNFLCLQTLVRSTEQARRTASFLLHRFQDLWQILRAPLLFIESGVTPVFRALYTPNMLHTISIVGNHLWPQSLGSIRGQHDTASDKIFMDEYNGFFDIGKA